jgi:hypothetical protein
MMKMDDADDHDDGNGNEILTMYVRLSTNDNNDGCFKVVVGEDVDDVANKMVPTCTHLAHVIHLITCM